MFEDLVLGDTGKVESLATAEDGDRNILGIGGGEKKLHMGRRLFQSFEEGVERFLGQHVDFVDDKYLESGATGEILNIGSNLTDSVDASVRGAVDLKDIDIFPRGDGLADFAFATRIRGGTVDTV